MKISLKEAISIAEKKAESLNYDIKKMKLMADENNNIWNNYSSSGFLEANPPIKDVLNGKDFWTIYFAPTEAVLGGDLFIFVDKKNGKVILALPGK